MHVYIRILINMLEEILALLLSLFSFVSNETPRVSLRETNHSQEESTNDDRWLPYLNQEYNIDFGEELTSVSLLLTNDDLHPGYNRIPGGSSSERKSFLKSFRKAIWTSISMAFSLFPPTAFTIMFLYIDLNTTDLCIEWQHHNNTVPLSVMRIRVIGRSVEAVIINLWLPLSAVILFGWKVFKLRFINVFYIAFIFGEATVIYNLFLLAFGVFETQLYYTYPSNILFFTGLIWCSIEMVHIIRRAVSLSYSNLQIMALVSTEFVVCSILSFSYGYAIVPFLSALKKRNTNFWWLRWP